MPVLLTLTDDSNEPRSTTFSGILKAVKKPVAIWSMGDVGAEKNMVGLAGSPTKIMKVEKTASHRKRLVIQGETVDAVVDNLLERLREDGIILGVG